MQQPELGKKLAEIRQLRNLTQEELVEACNVSVRTIQRIEAGEVTPRFSTIKILLTALEVDFEDFKRETSSTTSSSNNGTKWLQAAWISGIVYLLMAPFEIFGEYARSSSELFFSEFIDVELLSIDSDKLVYVAIKIIIMLSYGIMIYGFVQLAQLFHNYVLRVGSYLMIGVTILVTVTDVATLLLGMSHEIEFALALVQSIIVGGAGIVFGVGLIRLQDGMGRLAWVAGGFEIAIGCCFILVILFFLGYMLMLPANIIEIVLLYKGYEFLSKESNS